MSFYRNLPNDRPKTWFEEFSAEIKSDHRELLACRDTRAHRGDWSFNHAVARTRAFYVERFTGYCNVGSITETERDHLLSMVEALGTEDFPHE